MPRNQAARQENVARASLRAPATHTSYIRTPQKHDVLSGRGGAINTHEGNVAFRKLVSTMKTQYNLTTNKHEKAKISQEIIDQIHARGGRFLGKDESKNTSSSGTKGYWIVVEPSKATSKTSQALREGAPSIRKKAEVPASAAMRILGKRGRSAVVAPKNKEEVQPETKRPMIIRGMRGHRGKELILVSSQPELSSTPAAASQPDMPPPPANNLKPDQTQQYLDLLHQNMINTASSDMKDPKPGQGDLVSMNANSLRSSKQYLQKFRRNYAESMPPMNDEVPPPFIDSCHSSTSGVRSDNTSTPLLLPAQETELPMPLSITQNIHVPEKSLTYPVAARSLNQDEAVFFFTGPMDSPSATTTTGVDEMTPTTPSPCPGESMEPYSSLSRGHSLTLSEMAAFSDEDFGLVKNPFENENDVLTNILEPCELPPRELPLRSSSLASVTTLNRMIRMKSDTSNNSGMNGNFNTSINQNHTSTNHAFRRMNMNSETNGVGSLNRSASGNNSKRLRSLNSIMSGFDFEEINNSNGNQEEGFDQGMRTVYDITHPDLTSPRGGETIPTRLMQYARNPPASPSRSGSVKNKRKDKSQQ